MANLPELGLVTARGDDVILRLTRDHRRTLRPTTLVHICSVLVHEPRPALGGWTFRETLDPCATGACRYCGERLPVPPDKETEPSSALSP